MFWSFHEQGNRGLFFHNYHIDLGTLDYDSEIKATFNFKNTTRNLINIKQVKADCKCTNAYANKKEIHPGETGFVEVIFRSSNQPGEENHKIWISTDIPDHEKTILSISAVVDPRLEIIPRAISFGCVRNVREVNPREVSVVSRFRQSARTVSVSSSNPYIRATILGKQAANKREAGRIKIELCGSPPPGKLNGDIVLISETEKGIVNNTIKVMAMIENKV
jgi:hypothetical protein